MTYFFEFKIFLKIRNLAKNFNFLNFGTLFFVIVNNCQPSSFTIIFHKWPTSILFLPRGYAALYPGGLHFRIDFKFGNFSKFYFL